MVYSATLEVDHPKILQLIRSKRMSALLYGLEAYPLRSSDNNSRLCYQLLLHDIV